MTRVSPERLHLHSTAKQQDSFEICKLLAAQFPESIQGSGGARTCNTCKINRVKGGPRQEQKLLLTKPQHLSADLYRDIEKQTVSMRFSSELHTQQRLRNQVMLQNSSERAI